MKFDIAPVAKPRQTRRDRWLNPPRKCVQKYRNWSNEMRLLCLEVNFIPGDRLYLEFHLEMPKSWSKKKKAEMDGKPHQSRPDLDNMVKSLDALVAEDSGIWDLSAKKFWSYNAFIIMENKCNLENAFAEVK
jgi:Holliday junction resolvase RusA-like endonuclease